MTRGSWPLLGPRDLAAPLAWRHGQAFSGAQFLGEAWALAGQLPAAGRPLNLCQDRYLFALGLAAALLRGQTSLMPPNALPETLRQVPPDGPPPYLLVDGQPPAVAHCPGPWCNAWRRRPRPPCRRSRPNWMRCAC